jgi:very-short-patch-repair endonuclease
MSRQENRIIQWDSSAPTNASEKGEALVAILKERRDFDTLINEGWYRIPVQKAPRCSPPAWLAFYQPKVFAKQAYAVRYYGRVGKIEKLPRRVLRPDEPTHPKADQPYYRVELEQLQELPHPISSRRLRRIVFIPTTYHKLMHAEEINDLFNESPLEDRLWDELKVRRISAERQWEEKVRDRLYYLDFALFCNDGKIDIEADGDTWHTERERIKSDNDRNNDLTAAGWRVLRFNGQEIREAAETYCVSRITELVGCLGGLQEETIVPRQFYESPDGSAQQLALFENGSQYELD